MKKYRLPLIVIFVIICSIQLFSSWTGQSSLEYWVKPWIMVLITAWFLIYRRKRSFTVEVVLAFFFCWLGDVFLMLSHLIDVLFYAGVAAFLVGQVLYIRIFIRHKAFPQKGWLMKNPLAVLPYLIYLAAILILLFPKLDDVMKPVVTLYGLSLIGMAVAALNRKGRVSVTVFKRVLLGSVLFVLSDSMLAFNRFHTEFERSGFFIMLTYIAAQVLIMSGLVIEKEPAG